MSAPLLVDLEELLAVCDQATGRIVDSQAAADNEMRLEAFRDSLALVREIRIMLKDWVGRAKVQPVADLGDAP